MDSFQKITLVRIRIDSTDKFKKKPLYEVLLYAAQRTGVQDAIVLKGIMGVVSGKELYSHKSWEISEKVNFCGHISLFQGAALTPTTRSETD